MIREVSRPCRGFCLRCNGPLPGEERVMLPERILVIVETVGIGQLESDVAGVADTVLLCIQPGSGDSLQFMKAGVMELLDVVVVTKADMGEKARRALADVERALSLALAGSRRAGIGNGGFRLGRPHRRHQDAPRSSEGRRGSWPCDARIRSVHGSRTRCSSAGETRASTGFRATIGIYPIRSRPYGMSTSGMSDAGEVFPVSSLRPARCRILTWLLTA